MKIKLFLLVLIIPILIFPANLKIDNLNKKLTETSESVERVKLLIDLSLEYVEIDTIKSLEFSNQALELFDQLDPDDNFKDRADISKNIGYVYKEFKKYNRSLEYYAKGLDIYQKLELKPEISDVYYSIGIVYDLQNDYKKALQYFQKSLLIDKELNNKKGMATLCYLIGNEYELLSEYVKALESYLHCLKLYEELADQEGIGDSYNVIGNIFQSMGDSDSALEYYNKNLEIQEKIDNKYGISVAYNNIGIIYDDKKEYDKALKYYFKSLKIDEELNDTEGIASITNNLGIVYDELKEYDKALEYYQQSLSISEESNDIWAIANTSNNIAELYLALNQYTRSFIYVNKGFEYAESIDVKDVMLESFHIYSKLYSKTNDYQKAFEFFKKYTELKDTLFTTSIRKIAEFQRINETEKKEKENELLRKDNLIKDLQIGKQKNLKYSLFIIILLIIFSFLQIYMRYQGKRKENLLIIKKNELITQQKEQLDNAFEELKELNTSLEKNVEEINNSKERLQMLNKIIRHDLTNDFTVIKSAVNIFRKTSSEDMLFEIEKRVKRSLKTITDCKNYESFIESNLDLNEIEITERLDRIILEYPNIKINIEGNCKVFADDALDSVFTNLISNSIKHGNSSQIDIKISSDNNICKIEFVDNGIGIPDEIKDNIFDEGFYYGESGHTGIGLHIVKQNIEHYGGTIYIEDNEPKGTIFVINLKKVIN